MSTDDNEHDADLPGDPPGPGSGWSRVRAVGQAMDGLNPLPVLREAIKAVPAVKFALGVTGMAAAGSIVLYFLEVRYAIFILLLLFAMMTLLIVFSALGDAIQYLKVPAVIMAYAISLIGTASVGFLASSVFFDWPVRMRYVLEPDPRPQLDSVHVSGQPDQNGNLLVRINKIPNMKLVTARATFRDESGNTLLGPVDISTDGSAYDGQVPGKSISTDARIICEIEVFHGDKTIAKKDFEVVSQ